MGPVGKSLWAVIIVKLVVMFLILKLLFFPSVLGGLAPEEQAERVGNELINR